MPLIERARRALSLQAKQAHATRQRHSRVSIYSDDLYINLSILSYKHRGPLSPDAIILWVR